MTYTQPCAGYLYPTAAQEGADYDVDAIIAELAELEADPGTEEYDEAVFGLEGLSEWELLARIKDHYSEY